MKNLLLGLSLLCLSACSSISVTPDPVSGVNLAAYPSFKLGSGQIISAQTSGERGPINELLENSLRQALNAKGLKEDAQNGAMVVNYVAGTQTGADTQKLPAMVTYDRGSGWWNLGARTWSRSYTDSGMIIELRDSRTQKLLWRAFLQGEISSRSEGRKLERAIHEAFTTYPALPAAQP